jgi:polysaccharide biosynthesis protein PslH
MRPRLLFISPRFLFPMNEGGKIRTGNILREMRSGAFDITLASPAPANVTDFRTDIDAACDRFISWPERRPAPWQRVAALLSPLPVSAAMDRSAQGRAMVAAEIRAGKPDIVVADFPHAAVLHAESGTTPSVLFTHNVEAEIYERHAANATGLRRLIWREQARKMHHFERQTVQAYTTVIAVSARDAAALEQRFGLPAVAKIDTGVDLVYFAMQPPPARARADTIVFTGVLDSPANSDGIQFMMSDIWPLVARARPDAKALIVGRNPPSALREAARSRGLPWEFTGSVPDIRPYVGRADIAVIPLRVGSGTRIKAFEAMAMGRPVVSTSIGIEGLDIDPARHFRLADQPAAFAAAIINLLDDAGERVRLSEAARAHLEQHFSWAKIARQFEAICLETVKQFFFEKKNQKTFANYTDRR